jgi:hypothetical protein
MNALAADRRCEHRCARGDRAAMVNSCICMFHSFIERRDRVLPRDHP